MVVPFKLKAPKPPLEKDDQIAFMQWLYHQRYLGERIYDYCYAIPNGTKLFGDGRQRAIQWRGLQNMGAKQGYPDVNVDIPVAPHHGLRIEFKRKGGVPSDVSHEQLVWLDRLRYRGYRAEVAFGLAAAIEITCSYFNLEVPK